MTKDSSFVHVQNAKISFADFLRFKGFKEKSIRAHCQKMNKLPDFSYEAVMAQVTNLLRTHTKATVNKYLNTYRLYRKYLIETEMETEENLSWVDKFKHYHETHKQRLVFSNQELSSFLAINDIYSMYFKLLARTGARPMEIASLQKRDVDFANNLLQIQQTKTGDGRTIPIPEDLTNDFYRHITAHESVWCFPVKNHPEKHITLESLRKAFKKRQCQSGIRSELTPYCLRHTFITRMLGAGVPLYVVQSIVGHKLATTTQGYFHLDTKMQKDGLKRDPILWDMMAPHDKLKNVKNYIIDLGLDMDVHFDFITSRQEITLKILEP